jgi:predicted oxidoreductase (fatty acid repression mutant protein)
MQEQFPRYAENFTGWSRQANGMLQFNVWSNLRGLGIGASLQHYNPVIDEAVAELLEIPESWELIAQMPFGGIAAEPDPKPAEDPSARVSVKE